MALRAWGAFRAGARGRRRVPDRELTAVRYRMRTVRGVVAPRTRQLYDLDLVSAPRAEILDAYGRSCASAGSSPRERVANLMRRRSGAPGSLLQPVKDLRTS